MARNIAIILCILILAALFIFPRMRLDELCDVLEAFAEDTVNAVLAEDWKKAGSNLNEMMRAFEADRTFLHLLLSHDRVESLESAIHGCVRLIQVEDQPQTLMELEYIVTHVRYLRSIEELRLLTLL